MSSTTRARLAASAASAASTAFAGFATACVLSACAIPAPPADASRVAAPRDDEASREDFAQRQREAARAAEAQGRLADASIAWEVVGLLDPGDVEAASRQAGLRQRIDEGVAAHLARANEARHRGDFEGARREALQALALRPDDAQVAGWLRALEAEHDRRTVLARKAGPMGSRSAGPAAPASSPGSAPGGGGPFTAGMPGTRRAR